MHTFKDTAAREWRIEITVDTVRRIRSMLPDADPLKLIADNCALLGKLADDPVFLVDTLYVVCKPQADEAGASDEEFGRAMAGDCLLDGFRALVAGINDFFPDPQKRKAIAALVAKIRRLGEMMLAKANEQLETIDEAALSRVLTTFGNTSGASPVKSESTPAP